MKQLSALLAASVLAASFWSCNSPAPQADNGYDVSLPAKTSVKHPDWAKNLSIYEVNTRQYSQEGTFKKVEEDLPRLKELGVGILWMMPVHPIGEKNRKGPLGSYYAVRNYKEVSPEHGTMDDFKSLVNKAHEMGMYVIIDWVANHTAWDHPWATEHPEYFTKNDKGEFIPPMNTDWTDVIDLNYDNAGTRTAMLDALKFWVKECDIDGFRCDVAMEVPTDFWNNARIALDSIKPVFMLAEAELPEHHAQAFDMSYGWHFHHLMNKVAKGEEKVSVFDKYLKEDMGKFGADHYRMMFTSNHDENSWNGTVFERLGDSYKAFAVMAQTFPGMPLIYSGQEAGMDKRLKFFEKDLIVWKQHEIFDLYKKLNALKRSNEALWNGASGGAFRRLGTSSEQVFAYKQSKGEKAVVTILNLSAQPVEVTVQGADGTYTDALAGGEASLAGDKAVSLPAWGYLVLAK